MKKFFFNFQQPDKKAVCKRRVADSKSSKANTKTSSDASSQEGGKEESDKKVDSEKAVAKKGRKVVQPRIDEFVGKRKQKKKSNANVETDDELDGGVAVAGGKR